VSHDRSVHRRARSNRFASIVATGRHGASREAQRCVLEALEIRLGGSLAARFSGTLRVRATAPIPRPSKTVARGAVLATVEAAFVLDPFLLAKTDGMRAPHAFLRSDWR
jgi:hypothetical protein